MRTQDQSTLDALADAETLLMISLPIASLEHELALSARRQGQWTIEHLRRECGPRVRRSDLGIAAIFASQAAHAAFLAVPGLRGGK
jgi:hypothetical protein